MVYPSARIQGCNFHFNQLQLKQFRILLDYHSNEVLRIHLRCVYGLPFIPLTDAIDAWTKLKAVIWNCCPPQAMSKYITYFEKNWTFKQLHSLKMIELNRVSILFHETFRIAVELNFGLKLWSGILS